MAFDQHANLTLTKVVTAPSPAASGTSLVVTAGHGARFPTPPFNITVWPIGVQPTIDNAEILRVTNISTDTFTVTRAQEGTSARSIIVGDQLAATITKKTLTDVEAVIPAGTDGYIPFWASSVLSQDSNLSWDDTNNILKLSKMHIGAASATLYPFNLDAAPALSGTSYLTANFIATYTPTANFSESVTGFFAQTTLPLGGFNATGTIAGGFGSVRVTGSGTVNIAAGFRAVVTNINTAVITEAQCFRASIAGNVSTGSITTLSSFYSPDQTAGTTNIGFNGNISSGANKWNLYMGGTAKNYLAGNLGIGQTTPTAYLHIAAGTTAASTAPLKFTSGTFNTTAEAGAMEYNNVFALTESDATRRYIVQAASETKTTAGAPYANDGYITAHINGVDVKLMTTA